MKTRCMCKFLPVQTTSRAFISAHQLLTRRASENHEDAQYTSTRRTAVGAQEAAAGHLYLEAVRYTYRRRRRKGLKMYARLGSASTPDRRITSFVPINS
jgi:hypothetical protein